MRSFAVWFESENDEKKCMLEFHVNLWKKSERKPVYFFDFGLMIDDIKEIQSIFIYCPFELKKNQIKDLGSIISSNSLANAIFNEDLTTTMGKPNRMLVEREGKEKFIVYSIEVENQINLTNFTKDDNVEGDKGGTIIKLDIKSIKVEESLTKYYFRFRIKSHIEELSFVNNHIKGVSVLNNSFTNTEVIDFRLNDTRSFRESLKERFADGKKFDIESIHYLILRNENDSIIHHGDTVHSRILEKTLWKDYIDEDIGNIIAYHIKKKAINSNSANNQDCKYM